jgi:hypothetical protein
MNIIKAVENGNKYVEAGIKTSFDLGQGSGPINHFHSTYTLPFPPYVADHSVLFWLTDASDGFVEYLLQRDDVESPWEQYTKHEFVQRLADGSLPVEYFKHYLIQDYLFLVSTILHTGVLRTEMPRSTSRAQMLWLRTSLNRWQILEELVSRRLKDQH